jgi:alpha,alpha-trehalase
MVRRADGGEEIVLELDIEPGEHHDLVLVLAAGECPVPDPAVVWEATEAAWRARVPRLEQAIARRDARHAYAVLSGLTSEGGGMVAAATMSLPERAREGRNYDYRYVWIRDQCYAGQAVAQAGAHPLMGAAVRFVRERLLAHGPDLRPAYTVTGGRVPDEYQLDLAGYPGGVDVVGNRASEQFQLDVFGEALLLLAAAARWDALEADDWRALETAVEAIRSRWREPDAGIWELEPAVWTHSRLICAAGLRAVSRLATAGRRAADWLALADTITADTAARCTHRTGRWQRAAEDERVDAALLLPAVRGGVAADDPRSLATLDAFADELTEDGYAYRYRIDERPLGEAEGAFVLCGFIAALAFAQQDDPVAAAHWFERSRAACGPPGLLSEEYDVTQRQLRGNLPQAFAHALLLECAVTLPGQTPRG